MLTVCIDSMHPVAWIIDIKQTSEICMPWACCMEQLAQIDNIKSQITTFGCQ